jgi:hypothetical protein
MKIAFFIFLGLFLISISACKKDAEIVPQVFTLQGTWKINTYSLDSRGNLYASPFNIFYMQFYGDSVKQFKLTEDQRSHFGKYIINDKNTTAELDIEGLENEVVSGKNLKCFFTKETYYNTDGNHTTLQKLSHRGDVLNIVNRDSIFAYSYCCRGIFSMIRQ